MTWRPRVWRRPVDTTEEGRAALDHLRRVDDEVARLGGQLAEIQRANHFSAMVQIAIARSTRGS